MKKWVRIEGLDSIFCVQRIKCDPWQNLGSDFDPHIGSSCGCVPKSFMRRDFIFSHSFVFLFFQLSQSLLSSLWYSAYSLILVVTYHSR